MGVRDAAIVFFDGILKLLGVSHGTLGGLLIVMGIVVRVAVDHWTSTMLLAMWIGVLFAATGAIAVIDSNLEKADNSRKYYFRMLELSVFYGGMWILSCALLTDFLLFSVICLLLSMMLVVCYSIAVYTAFSGEEVGSFGWYSYEQYHTQNMLRVQVLSIIILIIGVLEFLLAIGSIGYVAHARKRDERRKPFKDDAPYSYENETYNSRL